MAIHKTEAIVLDRKDYRETSYLLSFFTAEFGKISAQAKGAKRKIDKFGTSFLPISFNEIVFYERSRSDLHIISQADLIENFDNIGKCIDRFSCAAYFLELVNAAMPYDERNKEVFQLLLDFLRFLNGEHSITNLAQLFEVKFLKLSGFKPSFDCCVSCSGQVEDKSKFSFVLGGLLCPKCISKDKSARNVMNGTIASINHLEKVDLRQFVNFRMIDSISKELEQLLRNFIDFHIGQQFKSLEFIKKVRFAYV
ncbi:MAG: DNA repair protein RecO [PVC group bacterium]|nr:DNA repair protein RecO [PVC group bacterium]